MKFDSMKDGIAEFADEVSIKTNAFHDKYISKVTPDCGKYGDAAKFAAEMAPGVSEYNAIRDGDWKAFAIAAGIDAAAIAAGCFTAGAGYAAVKGGTSVAKAGVKVAAKEVAEAGVKKAAKETAKAGVEKAAKETAKAGIEKAAKETVEVSVEKITKETVETSAEKVTKEAVETGTEKVTKEVTETGAEKAAKELSDEVVEKTDNIVHRYIECRNQGLEGSRHPVTGVKFVRRIVDDGTGELVEGVFPKFKSLFDTKIPKELYKSTNETQFKTANEHLLNRINSSPDLRNKFSAEQLEQIKDGLTPDGYVWHHNEKAGVLQLVDAVVHSQTGHTGGRAVWGGGY